MKNKTKDDRKKNRKDREVEVEVLKMPSDQFTLFFLAHHFVLPHNCLSVHFRVGNKESYPEGLQSRHIGNNLRTTDE